MNKKMVFRSDFMVEKRTDLALEVQEMRGRESGIEISTAKRSGIEITVASVHGEAGRKSSGKPEGKYITLDIGSGWQNDKALFEKTALALSAEIKSLLPKGVVGFASSLYSSSLEL